jgi:hypothetical protein
LTEQGSRSRWAPTRRWLFLLVAVALLALLGAGRRSRPEGAVAGGDLPQPVMDTLPPPPVLSLDPRVRAILESYGPLIDRVEYLGSDALFVLAGGGVYFQDGRMLSERHLGQAARYTPLFYDYSLRPLTTPPPLTDTPIYSTDFLEAAFGRTEPQIRRQGISTTFLNRRVFVNEYGFESLRAVERRIFAEAERDPEVSAWVEDIEVAYSFIDKEIVGSGSRSHHAWGLAIDLVPSSYQGRQVYWRWSRVFNRQNWHRIPLSERWNPPLAVIEAFEAHGFIWGGKWSHFDQIHFEFRPEILAYNRMSTR